MIKRLTWETLLIQTDRLMHLYGSDEGHPSSTDFLYSETISSSWWTRNFVLTGSHLSCLCTFHFESTYNTSRASEKKKKIFYTRLKIVSNVFAIYITLLKGHMPSTLELLVFLLIVTGKKKIEALFEAKYALIGAVIKFYSDLIKLLGLLLVE